MEAELDEQERVVDELQIDQAYARSSLAQRTMARGGQVICRPRGTNNGEWFGKVLAVSKIRGNLDVTPA